MHDGLDDVGQGTGNAVVGSAFARDDFVGVFASLSFGPFNMVWRHLGEGEEGLATDTGGRDCAKGRVAVLAQDISMDALGTDADAFAQVEAETSGI